MMTFERKSPARMLAEEEAQRVIEEARTAAETRALARAKAREDSETWFEAAKDAAKAKAEAIAAEEARIAAVGKDEWYYIRNGERFGPVGLTEMRAKAADASLDPPVHLVWTEGMDGWRPVFDVRKVCDPNYNESPGAQSTGAASVFQTVSEVKAEQETKAAAENTKACEEARANAELEERLRAAAEAQALAAAKVVEEAQARAAEEVRLAAEARTKAEEEAKLATAAKAAAEARISAETKARAAEEARAKAEAEAKLRAAEAKLEQESQRRAAAETKAAEEARLAAAANAKAAEEARLRATAEEARIASAARAKAMEEAAAKAEAEAMLRAAAEAQALEEVRQAAAAKTKAAEAKLNALAAKAAEEAKAKIEAEAKLRAAAEQKAREEAKLRASIEAKAAADNQAARETTKALQKKVQAAEEAIAKAEAKAAEASRKPKGGKSSKNGWFYTCEGDRLGPVSFEELRTMAAASSLDPRRDMVWKEGMDTWKPAGKIDGLFERNNALVETEPSSPCLQQALSSIAPAQQTARSIKASGDAPWPGARRRSMLVVSLILPIVWHYALSAGSPFLIGRFGEMLMAKLLPFAGFLPLAVLVHFSLKRFMNLGMSRWWLFGFLAPLLNLWLGYRCLACPSGYAQHKKLDGPGIALAIIYWLVMFAVVAVMVIALAPLFGSLDGINAPARLRALMGRFSA